MVSVSKFKYLSHGRLQHETCGYTQTLLQTMESFSMFPVVDKPTRIYGNSATLTDNIFISNPENNIVCGNVVSDTTDHFSQMCILTSQCKHSFQTTKLRFVIIQPFMQNLLLTTCRILIGIIFTNILMLINRSPGFTNASIT